MDKGKIDEIISFILTNESSQMPNENSIIEELKAHLPSYMVPKRIFFVREVPYNINGKVDRNKLVLSVSKSESQ